MSMIMMSRLGRMGRWGNQVFQYMFLRTYARRYNLDYCCPPWEGQRLFGLCDPPMHDPPLPQYNEQWDKNINHSSDTAYQDAWSGADPPKDRAVVSRDYSGYCQFHTSYYVEDRSFIRKLFTPTTEVQERMQPVLNELRGRGKTIIGLHMRRGDTGRAVFYLTPNQWYRNWLQENWKRFDNPVLFIASENLEDAEEFKNYNPVRATNLLELKASRYALYNYLQCDLSDPTPEAMDWFPDWYLLSNCDVLVFGESTFSFSAAMLNPNLQEAWRSRLSLQRFEQVDPWNADPLCREHLDDYPGIPGTFYANNPKWEGGEVMQ